MAGQVPMVGGFAATRDATPEVQSAADTVKPAVEEQLGRKLCVYRATSYSSQVVAGTIYLIKVDIGAEDNYLHIKVFVPLPHTNAAPSLEGVQTGKRRADPLNNWGTQSAPSP